MCLKDKIKIKDPLTHTKTVWGGGLFCSVRILFKKGYFKSNMQCSKPGARRCYSLSRQHDRHTLTLSQTKVSQLTPVMTCSALGFLVILRTSLKFRD